MIALVALVYGQDTSDKIKEGAKKGVDSTVDGAKKVGSATADGYDATKKKLNEKSVAELGDDAVEGSKNVWTKTKDSVSSLFQN